MNIYDKYGGQPAIANLVMRFYDHVKSSPDLDRMFERFYRGDPARARGPRNGSGLGLAIVRQIALSQGGLVRARNHPGGGAVVELLLPRA